MRVLVTGGFGYVGGAAAAALAEAGAKVVALCRDESEARTAAVRGWRPVLGCLEDTARLRGAAAGVDAVVHCAASDAPDFLPVNRAAIAALLGGLPEGRGLVMQAGTLLFGPSPEPGDGSGPLAPPPFLAARAALEAEAAETALRRGQRLVVVHAALAWGGSGGAIPRALAAAARGLGYVAVPPPGSQRWATVHVADWGALIARAAAAAPPGPSRFVAASGEIAMEEFALRLGAALGLPARPADPAALGALGPLGAALSLPQRFTGARARDTLGWLPGQADLDAALRALAAQGRQSGG